VASATGASEALEKVRSLHPEIVILGHPEPPGDAAKLSRELREGWISRHSSLLMIEENVRDHSYRIINEEKEDTVADAGVLPALAAGAFVQADALLAGLQEKIQDILDDRCNALKDSILDPEGFCVTWEQIPGLGAFEIRQELVLENARKAAQGGKICAISIVDNPGGNPAIATEILCSEIHKIGIEPMVHLAFRDKSRNQVESLLYQLAALDINNLLILTGDYPSNAGFQGMSRPVFDLDSVNGLQLIAAMNRGMEHEIMRKKTSLAPTDFFAGVACSPFKMEEAEVMGQYYKLKKKIEAGADFIITQIGYDFRKLHELQLWLKTHGYKTPILISIQVLTPATARAMHDNRVPGCVITDKLLAQITEESKSGDKGRQSRLDRAAKMFAVARGMGFTGACISGQNIPYESVEYIIEKGQELTPDWPDFLPEFDYPQEKGFYYFEKGDLPLSSFTRNKDKLSPNENGKSQVSPFEKGGLRGIFPGNSPVNPDSKDIHGVTGAAGSGVPVITEGSRPGVTGGTEVGDISVPAFDQPGKIVYRLNLEKLTPRSQKPAHPVIYYLSRALHISVFEPASPLFKILRPVMRWIDSSRVLSKMFGSVEYWIKAALYGCMNCGDCALFDAAYLCPVSQCPKNQRNGPCGGSYHGWCEVYPGERKCIWVRAYLRLKAQHKEDSIGELIVPPCNWELWQSSSWLNYFMGRDHVSRRTGLKPPWRDHSNL
jgi:5,10-methylenetetrahydrofolate reductase